MVTKFKRPWFNIISIDNDGKKSLTTIAKEICEEYQVSLLALRGMRMTPHICAARNEFYMRAADAMPDLSSGEIGVFIGRDGSTIRRLWKRRKPRAA